MGNNARRANGTRRTALTRWLRAQARPCWICGLPIDYGAPQGSPVGFECDELVPVSRGGSPFEKANVDAAHRCCNNWRRAKGVSEVVATRSAVAARFGGWSSAADFVAKAKALRSAQARPQGAQRERVTTDWL